MAKYILLIILLEFVSAFGGLFTPTTIINKFPWKVETVNLNPVTLPPSPPDKEFVIPGKDNCITYMTPRG